MATKLQIELQRAESAGRLADIGALPDEQRTGEIETEESGLQAKLRSLNSAFISAALLEERSAQEQTIEHADGDAAGRELRGMLERANAGAIFDSALSQRVPGGVESELQTHFGLPSNSVPTALLEQRATVTAPTSAQNQQAAVPSAFPSSVATFMAIERPTVAVGMASYPVVTTPTAGPDSVAKAADAVDTDSVITASNLTPRRVQVSFVYAREDAATFRNLDSLLRSTLRDAVADGLDKMALNLTDAGLLEAGTDPTALTGAETYARYEAVPYALVDGRYASSTSELYFLVGARTYTQMASLYRTGSSEQSALDLFEEITGGVRVSANVEAATLQQSVVRRGSGRGCIQPVWPGVEILADPFTKSIQGEVRLTALALSNFAVLVQGRYVRDVYRT